MMRTVLSTPRKRVFTAVMLAGLLAACTAVFAATVWSDLNPKSKWTPWVWAGAVELPSYTAWQRVPAGKHFPTDVLVGLAVGAVLGRLVPVLHRVSQSSKKQPKPITLL